MSATPELQVLVVGAGPTGLTMAIYLAQRDINVRIIEQAPKVHGGIRGTAIHPRTQELLAILGAEKDVFEVATGPLQMAVYGPDGKTILKAFEWSEAAEDDPTIPFRRTASISQAQLEIVLRRHLKKYGCEVEMGKQLVGISQDEDKVTAKVAVAKDGTEVLIECDYLVAADGAKGSSRNFLGVSFLGETNKADRLWTANVEIPGFSREYWHRWGDFSKAATSLKPVNPAPLFHMLSLGPSLPNSIPMDLSGTQQLFNSIAGRDDLELEKAAHMSEWKANIRMTDRFSVGRVFLAGDVAHCHSPSGGQGTNTAMQDAFNLAWKLALVVNHKASPSLLKSYESERMPVVAEMLNLSNALHARAFAHIPTTAFETPQTGDAPPDPMQRTKSLLQLGINYRWSDIVFDEREDRGPAAEKSPYGPVDTQVRAGDRAPYIGKLAKEGGRTTDLFSLLREAPFHLVLFFPSPTTAELESLAPIESLVDAGLVQVIAIVESEGFHTHDVPHLVDTQGIARKVYVGEPSRAVYVTIRPDGIIGAYTLGLDGIREYFTRLGTTF